MSEQLGTSDEVGEPVPRDPAEQRQLPTCGTLLGNMRIEMSGSQIVSTVQQRIAKLANEARDMSFTSLNRYLTVEWLREAYHLTRKDGAVGVDGQTATQYEKNLTANLEALKERSQSGTYVAPPVRRTYIPKGSGKELRPLGIPSFEDKVLQRSVCMLLEPIYEQDFYDCSYGFRPGRSQHQCVRAIRDVLYANKGGHVIEVDIRKYFDTIDKTQLQELISKRVRDGVIKRLIGKWLNAGIMEKGEISYAESGTPQGGVASPLMANIYLHYVLDEWFVNEVQPRMKAEAHLFRFADDFLVICKSEHDANSITEVIPKRFGKFGLAIHPDKTRLIDFRRPYNGQQTVVTFNFLGFTFYWGKTQAGWMTTKLCTAKDRQKRSLRKLWTKCREIRHLPMKEQWKKLNQSLRGHYNYYGVSFNHRQPNRLWHQAERYWRFWLDRRSQKPSMPWERFEQLLEVYPLVRPKVAVALF